MFGIDDIIPQILWTRYFPKSQGITPKKLVVYENNQIKLGYGLMGGHPESNEPNAWL